MPELSDLELLEELGVETVVEAKRALTPRQERIIAGFEDIQKFVAEHGRAPQHGEGRDIFERLYAVRLDRLRAQAECRDLLAPLDTQGLLEDAGGMNEPAAPFVKDADLLAELGVPAGSDDDISQLKHVRPREEIRAAEEITSRQPCKDFATFRPLFEAVATDLKAGVREARRFGENAAIKLGEFFILGGQIAYVATVPEELSTAHGHVQGRLRVIFDNGTESEPLLRSFQRALYKDETGRRITDPEIGPLFGNEAEPDDLESGTLYVLSSRSNHPYIAEHRDVIHKIGVTGQSVERRIAGAVDDPTYLLAGVDVVATYKLYNIKRSRLEALIHRALSAARLDLSAGDRFGKSVQPREWFMVPLPVIDELVSRILDGSIARFRYDKEEARFVEE
jgi:hypothetical protein